MPFRRVVVLVLVLFALLSSPRRAGGADPVGVRVRPTVANEPATLRVTIRLEQDDQNRQLTVELESDSFFRSSSRTLGGEFDQRVYDFIFSAVPSGTYEVRSIVARANGSRDTRRLSAMVLGPGGVNR